MKNKSSTQFSVNTWDKMNIFLFISTLITTVTFLILFGACFLMEIGSDCHGMKQRKSNMGKCRDYLYKKYDEHYVVKILEGKRIALMIYM